MDVANFNDNHKKFGHKYIERDELDDIPNIIRHRMNKANGFDDDEIIWPFNFQRCPSEAKYLAEGWVSFAIGELENNRSIFSTLLPQLERDNISAIYHFVVGNYRIFRGANSIESMRKLEVDEHLDSIDGHEAYLDAVRELPQDTKVYARLLGAPPTEGWVGNEEVFGPCPDGSELLLYMKMPSSNRSKKDL